MTKGSRGVSMVEVYYYVPIEELENAVECGLKLSKWYDKEVLIGLERTKCISALLNLKMILKNTTGQTKMY